MPTHDISNPPELKKYRARVRFNKQQGGPWEVVEAFSPGDAASQIISQHLIKPGKTLMFGSLPVEVTEEGSVAVKRFQVNYSLRFTATELL